MNGPTRQPRHSPAAWEPEPLHLPVESPQRRTRRPGARPEALDDVEDSRPEDDRPGGTVVVIDIG